MRRAFGPGAAGLFIELGAFAVAVAADMLWKLWSRRRWKRWAFGRAKDLDAVKVHAMFDGVIPKDQTFLRKLAERQAHSPRTD